MPNGYMGDGTVPLERIVANSADFIGHFHPLQGATIQKTRRVDSGYMFRYDDVLDFRATLERLHMNSRQRGRKKNRIHLVVRSKRTGADIFATFGQHDFLHAYLLAQLGGHKLYIRTEDKITIPIIIQIIEHSR